jgi:hypothetical protein
MLTVSDQPAAKQHCEHYWAFHCFGGLTIRLCQVCHEPDWEDFRGQHAEAVRQGILSERQRLSAGVSDVLTRYERDAVFTAPEALRERRTQLRWRLSELFDNGESANAAVPAP